MLSVCRNFLQECSFMKIHKLLGIGYFWYATYNVHLKTFVSLAKSVPMCTTQKSTAKSAKMYMMIYLRI